MLKPTSKKWFLEILHSLYSLEFIWLIGSEIGGIKNPNTFRIVMVEVSYLLVEAEEGRELHLATDNLGNRKVIMRMQNTGMEITYFKELFSSLGFDVYFQNVRLLNPTDDVKKWNVDYNAVSDYNARRITLMNP